MVVPVTYVSPAVETATSGPRLCEEFVSMPFPPRYVEYTKPFPAAVKTDTNMSAKPPPAVGWWAFATGKLVDHVTPATCACPIPSTPTLGADSNPPPPR
jgi:hypothetical protein